jgi:methionyl-tRNA formyltransferase
MNKVRTLFIGSGNFGIPTLEALSKLEFIDLVGILTQPDKPSGRKMEMTPTPIKEFSTKNLSSLPIRQPIKFKLEAEQLMDEFKPELIIVAAYGQIISQSVLDYPKYGALNLHGSLLPLLRGAVPVNMAILQGFKETGVTLQKMVFKMDAGDIVKSEKIKLGNGETCETLMGKLGQLASIIIIQNLKRYIDGEIQLIPQDESKATFCFKEDISKEKAEIKFSTDIVQAERMVCAFYPWPISWFKQGNKLVKIYKAKIHNSTSNSEFKLIKEGKSLILQLQNGSLELLELQLEGKKRDLSQNYLYLGAK